MLRTNGAKSDWSALLGEAARPLGAQPVPPPLSDLSDPELFLGFFDKSLDFAISPHKSRRPLAIGSGIFSKFLAWGWICEQICVDALHPSWPQRPQVGQPGILFADLFHNIGDCRLPICIGPTVAPQLFACWRTISDLRIEKNRWSVASDDPAFQEFFEIASRNVSRARSRVTIERRRGQMDPESAPQDAVGNIVNEQSDDELLPLVPEELLPPKRPCPVLGPEWDTIPNPTTPRRDAEAPPPT